VGGGVRERGELCDGEGGPLTVPECSTDQHRLRTRSTAGASDSVDADPLFPGDNDPRSARPRW
jgi:hypothetical protein